MADEYIVAVGAELYRHDGPIDTIREVQYEAGKLVQAVKDGPYHALVAPVGTEGAEAVKSEWACHRSSDEDFIHDTAYWRERYEATAPTA